MLSLKAHNHEERKQESSVLQYLVNVVHTIQTTPATHLQQESSVLQYLVNVVHAYNSDYTCHTFTEYKKENLL